MGREASSAAVHQAVSCGAGYCAAREGVGGGVGVFRVREEEAGVGTDRYGYRAVRGEDGREKDAGSFGMSPGRLFVVSGFGAMPYLNLL